MFHSLWCLVGESASARQTFAATPSKSLAPPAHRARIWIKRTTLSRRFGAREGNLMDKRIFIHQRARLIFREPRRVSTSQDKILHQLRLITSLLIIPAYSSIQTTRSSFSHCAVNISMRIYIISLNLSCYPFYNNMCGVLITSKIRNTQRLFSKLYDNFKLN